MMVFELQRQIAEAISSGARLDEVEEAIIAWAPIDEDEKAALWLYADALAERREVANAEAVRL